MPTQPEKCRRSQCREECFLSTVSHELRTPLTSVLALPRSQKETGRKNISDHGQIRSQDLKTIEQISGNLSVVISKENV
jgi:signal transduction histidine kinase